jgi:cytochrome c biogenesis protein CcdA
MVELTITLPIIIGAAVIDSINPCAFGVLIFLLSYLAHSVKTKTRMLTQGLVYVLGVFITYLVAGLILLPIIQKLGAFSVGSYMAIGIIVIIAGLLENGSHSEYCPAKLNE